MLTSDTLFHVTRLFLLFQKEEIDLRQIQPLVHTCIESVAQLGERSGPVMETTDAASIWLLELQKKLRRDSVSMLTQKEGLAAWIESKQTYGVD